jgi:hypothetical protein
MKFINFIRLFLLVLIVIGIGLLLTQNIWVPSLVSAILSHEPKPVIIQATSQNTSGEISCKDSSDYFVIIKSLNDSVGSDILVKYKAEKNQNLPCEYVVNKNDFEIKNAQAEYFLAISDHFLILDSGTAPYPRGLIVYDLNARKIVFTDKYSAPFSANGNFINYWNPTKTAPTSPNCPQLADYTKNGLGAEIEASTTLNLSNLTKQNLGEYRCSAVQ